MSENKVEYGVVQVSKSSPTSVIQKAIEGGANLEQLEKLMILQERWEATEAKKAYVKAMAAFKANPPKIEKDKKVAYNSTAYNHASLANVTTEINASLSTHGLSASWSTKQDGVGITVTCTITHDMGHSESTALTAEADTSGQKNKIQAIGSTITYLERYTILALTGLATHDQDDDGKGSEADHITDEQFNELHSLIVDNLGEGYLPTFLKYCKVDALSDIPAKDFKRRIAEIKTVISKAGKGAK